MAGDWIKMRLDLQTHPKVVRILSATESDKFRVIGGLHAVWAVFDQHSEDGVLRGYTPELMDHVIGWPGFSRAMIEVDWLQAPEEKTLVMPEFESHNGRSGKRRAEDQKRKKASRKRPQSVRNLSEEGHSEMRTREEKRREEKEDSRRGDESPREFIWRVGVDLLTSAGEKDRSARSFLGGLCKNYGDDQVREAVGRAAAVAPAEPKAWLEGALRKSRASHDPCLGAL